MNKRWPESETELAAAIVAWLRQEQWEVYQEVQLSYGSSIADIIAVRDPVVWVIETKRSLTLEAINQAERWHYYAHLASVAVPKRKRDGRPLAGARVCRLLGVGLLCVQPPSRWQAAEVIEEQRSRFDRRSSVKRTRQALCEEHKTFAAAGNAECRRWSPWRATCEELRKSVERAPGMSLKEAIESIETHYHSQASARSSLSHWLQVGKIDGVRCERDGRYLRLYPSG
jgi:hypothetical protein